MATRSNDNTITTHFKSYTTPVPEFEVWVLGTWKHETGDALIVFTGTQEACIAHRKASNQRADLAIRITARSIKV